jgi:4-amino-4-deoxy-L-arabinose transferase-like glycosyltransferase
MEKVKYQKLLKNAWQIFLLLACIWFFTTLSIRNAPEWDNMEELVWASSFEWGYQKHPPLPSWIIYPLTMLFGKVIWLPFALGFISVVFSQWIVYNLYIKVCQQSKDVIPSYAPLVFVLTGSLILYYTVRGGDYNHNSMQLWSIAAMFYFYYSAWVIERNTEFELKQKKKYFFFWILLGLFTGLALLSKYSAVVQITVLFVHFLFEKRFLKKNALQGIIVSVVICLLIMSQHLIWLFDQTSQGQGPLFYAKESLSDSSTYLSKLIELFNGFLLTQILRVSPVILALYLLIRLAKNTEKAREALEPNKNLNTTWWKRLSQKDRIFLVFFTAGPTLVALFIGILFGQKIEAKWAVTFYLGIGIVCAFVAREIDVIQFVKKILWLHLIFAIGYALIVGPGADYLGKQGRGNFPSKKLSEEIQLRWLENSAITLGKPISLIAGDTWIIGNVIINDPISRGRNIKAWIDANDLESPWLFEADKKTPLLILMDYVPTTSGKWWRGGHPPSAKVMELFAKASVKGVVSIPWTSNENAPPLQVQWAILPSVEEP